MTNSDRALNPIVIEEVPSGFDAICMGCNTPYTFGNSKHMGTTLWQEYCCRTCAGEPVWNERKQQWMDP